MSPTMSVFVGKADVKHGHVEGSSIAKSGIILLRTPQTWQVSIIFFQEQAYH